MLYLIILNILQCVAIAFLYYKQYKPKVIISPIVNKVELPPDFQLKTTPIPSNEQAFKPPVPAALEFRRSSYNTPRQ